MAILNFGYKLDLDIGIRARQEAGKLQADLHTGRLILGLWSNLVTGILLILGVELYHV